MIELDENPFPKSYKWLRWLFFIIVVIVIIAIIVGYWGNINSSFGSTVEKIGNTLRGADEYKVPAIVVGAGSIVEEVENTRDRDTVSVVAGFDYVFDTVPLTWFEPEFAIPKNVIGRVYVLYHKAQNSSWCYLDGADVPDNEYTITKMADGKGIIFKGTDGTTFDGKSFTVAFPADYDPDNNYMFYFADGAGE